MQRLQSETLSTLFARINSCYNTGAMVALDDPVTKGAEFWVSNSMLLYQIKGEQLQIYLQAFPVFDKDTNERLLLPKPIVYDVVYSESEQDWYWIGTNSDGELQAFTAMDLGKLWKARFSAHVKAYEGLDLKKWTEVA